MYRILDGLQQQIAESFSVVDGLAGSDGAMLCQMDVEPPCPWLLALAQPDHSFGVEKNSATFMAKQGCFPASEGPPQILTPLPRREVSMRSKDSFLGNVIVLALMGILAGALAGLGVGAMTGRSASSTTTAAT